MLSTISISDVESGNVLMSEMKLNTIDLYLPTDMEEHPDVIHAFFAVLSQVCFLLSLRR